MNIRTFMAKQLDGENRPFDKSEGSSQAKKIKIGSESSVLFVDANILLSPRIDFVVLRVVI